MKWQEAFEYFAYHSAPERHSEADEIKAANFKQALTTMKENFKPDQEITSKDIGSLPLTTHMKELVASLEFMPRRHSDLRSELMDVYGIGPVEAKRLEDHDDVKSLQDLRKAAVWSTLSSSTQKWLSHSPAPRVSREELERDLVPVVKKAAKKSGSRVVIVGSVRRKAKLCADLDVLLVGGKSSISKTIKALGDKVVVFSQGSKMAHLLYKTPKKSVRLDLYASSEEDEPTMLLWTTGPERFNILLRHAAEKRGMELNQYGLFKNGKKIPTKSERDVFEKLGENFVDPSMRGVPKC